jgi:hypothetical protein
MEILRGFDSRRRHKTPVARDRWKRPRAAGSILRYATRLLALRLRRDLFRETL